MQITFFGAARYVTGSKHLITLENGRKILLDCGMFQGEGRNTGPWNRHFGFSPHKVDYLILSHAHIDHSGLIPRLVHEGFTGKIFSTAATRDLCRIMLEDSAEIQEEDFEHLQREGKVGEDDEPLYRMEDVNETMRHFQTVPYNKPWQIEEGIELTFTDAGHIIGSAVVNLSIREKDRTVRICFTGDVGRYDRHILRDPQPFPQADYIICESTYGDRLHQSRTDASAALRQLIYETCILKKGKLIIPAFSLGRTQDLIYQLNRLDFEDQIPDIPVFIDSPLSKEVTEVVDAHPECFDEETLAFRKKDPHIFSYPSMHFVRNVEQSRRLNEMKGAAIIIASSGMLEAGRIRHHLIHHLDDERNTLLMTSFAPEESLADRLKRGDKHVEIWGRLIEVRANVVSMDGFSAHGDRDELLRFLSCQDTSQIQKVFLVHGEFPVQLEFKKTLLEHGYPHICIPEKGDTEEL